jgi:hypothetical protein
LVTLARPATSRADVPTSSIGGANPGERHPLGQFGSLLMKLSRCSFPCGFLLGDAGAALGDLGLLGSAGRRFAMLAGDVLTTLSQLTLAGGDSHPLTSPCPHQSKRNQNQYDDNDDADQCRGHQTCLLVIDTKNSRRRAFR